MTAREHVEDRWEHWLVHLLWSTSTRTSILGEGALAGSPISLSGLGLLENVGARPGITISHIARRAPQTQQALSQVAARLADLGLLERKLVPGGRGIALHLTEAGERIRREAHDAIEAFDGELAVALGPRRHQRLVRLLEEADSLVGQMGRRPAPAD